MARGLPDIYPLKLTARCDEMVTWLSSQRSKGLNRFSSFFYLKFKTFYCPVILIMLAYLSLQDQRFHLLKNGLALWKRVTMTSIIDLYKMSKIRSFLTLS